VDLIAWRDVFAKTLQSARAKGASVGFVPTMGALHAGHASLMAAARSQCDCVAVSIFVNPTQFGDDADLAAYPRDLDADLTVCEAEGADVVFAPSVSEMYPDGDLETAVVPGRLAEMLEGTVRPGHFTAVATIVTKLLSLAGPCQAYFGEKDYQQLVVVGRLVADLDLPAVVVGCPTVREPDGLALSSRNRRLGPAERAAAPRLFRALSEGAALVVAGERSGNSVAAAVSALLDAEPLIELDYVAVADPVTLMPVGEIAAAVRLLVAARLGPVRLIDNVAAAPARPAQP
jgi:pantoate--beta-alanine ligase